MIISVTAMEVWIVNHHQPYVSHHTSHHVLRSLDEVHRLLAQIGDSASVVGMGWTTRVGLVMLGV